MYVISGRDAKLLEDRGCSLNDRSLQGSVGPSVGRLSVVHQFGPLSAPPGLLEGSQQFLGAISIGVSTLGLPVLPVPIYYVDDTLVMRTR